LTYPKWWTRAELNCHLLDANEVFYH